MHTVGGGGIGMPRGGTGGNNAADIRSVAATANNSATATATTSTSSTSTPQFFTDHRRSEVNELRQLLKLARSDRSAIQRQRDAVKRVVAFMTLGIDVAPLFSEMVMACGSTDDVVQKKMIYLYLTNYAETSPDLALLTVNTLTKDCRDEDPAIRGLALRSLCSARSQTLAEYMEPAIRRGLGDRSGYVRKTAVMGVLKLFHLHPPAVNINQLEVRVMKSDAETLDALVAAEPDLKTAPLLEILVALLEDKEPGVAANVIFALNEILARQGGIPFTRRIIANLLNRVRDFDEWGQCAILNILSHYIPANEEELYDLLTLLELRLKHTSSAVVLAAAKIFVQAAELRPNLKEQIMTRLKGPLLTLIAAATNESAFVILNHLLLLLRKENSLAEALSEDFKLFFCGHQDPAYLKLLKLQVLQDISSQHTATAILEELAESVVTETELKVATKAMACMGVLGRKFPSIVDFVLDKLLSFVDLGLPQLAAPAVTEIAKLLRKYPNLADGILPLLEPIILSLPREQSASGLWIVGQFCNEIDNAPYILEEIVNDIIECDEGQSHDDGESVTQRKVSCSDETTSEPDNNNNDDDDVNNEFLSYTGTFVTLPPEVLYELLSASVKCFLARPAETQKTLGILLTAIIVSDCVDFDVRDRAIFYHRWITKNLQSLLTVMANNHDFPFDLPTEKSRKNHLERTRADENQAENDGESGDPHTSLFSEEEATDAAGNITAEEFNSLAALFKQRVEQFVKVSDPIDFGGRFIPPKNAQLLMMENSADEDEDDEAEGTLIIEKLCKMVLNERERNSKMAASSSTHSVGMAGGSAGHAVPVTASLLDM